jgi:small subunit ribosomal protein S17
MIKGQRKRLVGTVTSDKMDKTVVVTVEQSKRHPLYGKVVRRARKFMVHNADNAAHQGDVVRIVESRPLSASKRWAIVEIVKKAGE